MRLFPRKPDWLCRLIEDGGAHGSEQRSSRTQELKRQIELAKRLASVTTDQTTYQRLKEFADELRQGLERHLAARRSKHAIRARARELWEQEGRDLDFWLQAEPELKESGNE
jgi:hypothetical protein